MNIPVVEGRDFRKSDEHKDHGVYILNETAQQHYPVEIGGRFPDILLNELKGTAVIVGFAKNFNYKPLQYPIESIAFYVPFEGFEYPLLQGYIKITDPDTRSAVEFVRNTLLDIDPDAANRFHMEFVNETIVNSYKEESDLASLITAFSILAILISTIGIFGLIMFETQYRRREIGVRKVFGATVNQILAMFNKSYMKIVGICFVISSPIAFYIVKSWLEGFHYRTPMYIWVYLVALLIISVITTFTVTFQSYRAATENPAGSVKLE